MTLPVPGSEAVTFHTKTGSTRDGDGNNVPIYTDTVVLGCLFDPGGSTELVQGQDVVVSQPTLYVPPAAAIPRVVDQATVRGVRYDIDGDPNLWSDTEWTPGIVVKLKAVSG